MIERADSTIRALQKMVVCKQLMPDKIVVIVFSIVINGALQCIYAGLKSHLFFFSSLVSILAFSY